MNTEFVYTQKDEGDSSFIKAAYRNEESGDTVVEFRTGDRVLYHDIPDYEWAEYTARDQSRGAYYNSEWKAYANAYDAEKFEGSISFAARPVLSEPKHVRVSVGTDSNGQPAASVSKVTRLLGTEAPLTAAEIAAETGFDVTFRTNLGTHTFYTPADSLVEAAREFEANTNALGLGTTEVTFARK